MGSKQKDTPLLLSTYILQNHSWLLTGGGSSNKEVEHNAVKFKSLRIRLGKCGTLLLYRFWHVKQEAPCWRLEIPLTLNKGWRIQTMYGGYIKMCHISVIFWIIKKRSFRIILICIMPANNTEFHIQPYVRGQKQYLALIIHI